MHKMTSHPCKKSSTYRSMMDMGADRKSDTIEEGR